jgi:hypothetical protein
MSLKITLTIDQENEQGVVLIGLLTKALGRGEAGVSDMRIERDGELEIPEANEAWFEKAKLGPVRQSTIAKMVVASPPKRKRKGYELGMRASKSGKPNGVSIMLRALKLDASLDGIREMWRAYSLNPNGVGATLSKMAHRGYCKRVGDGVWKLTSKGAELEQRLSAEVKHGGQD